MKKYVTVIIIILLNIFNLTLLNNEKTMISRTTNGGYFYFEDIPTGSIFSISVNQGSCKGVYSNGDKIEAWANYLELDIEIFPKSKPCTNQNNIDVDSMNTGIIYHH